MEFHKTADSHGIPEGVQLLELLQNVVAAFMKPDILYEAENPRFRDIELGLERRIELSEILKTFRYDCSSAGGRRNETSRSHE